MLPHAYDGICAIIMAVPVIIRQVLCEFTAQAATRASFHILHQSMCARSCLCAHACMHANEWVSSHLRVQTCFGATQHMCASTHHSMHPGMHLSIYVCIRVSILPCMGGACAYPCMGTCIPVCTHPYVNTFGHPCLRACTQHV